MPAVTELTPSGPLVSSSIPVSALQPASRLNAKMIRIKRAARAWPLSPVYPVLDALGKASYSRRPRPHTPAAARSGLCCARGVFRHRWSLLMRITLAAVPAAPCAHFAPGDQRPPDHPTPPSGDQANPPPPPTPP